MIHILLVEDDKTIALGIDYALKQEGYHTIVCYSAKEAEESIKNNIFDLAVLDVALPDGDGYELCRRIREKSDIPVIFVTAMDEEVNVVMGLDMGADDYITKPFRVRELLSRIRSVLRRYNKSSDSSSEITIKGYKNQYCRSQGLQKGRASYSNINGIQAAAYIGSSPGPCINPESNFRGDYGMLQGSLLMTTPLQSA
jgi:DNA-binding response OmpR family regulator